MNPQTPASTRRTDLTGLLGDLVRLEEIFADWEETPRGAVEAYRRAIEALHGEALRRLIRGLKDNPEALAALKQAASDEVVYAVLRHHELVKPSLTERVEAALAAIRPMLASHGGDVALVRVEPPTAEVRFTGACDGCSASILTFQAGVRKAIRDACPEITDVIQAKGTAGPPSGAARFVSPFAAAGGGDWIPACDLSELPDGGLRAMTLGGQPVVLFRRGAAVTCFQDACAHLGLAIRDGAVEDGVVTCPHHGFRYDLASGECLTAPEVQLQAHVVQVVDDRVEVRLAE